MIKIVIRKVPLWLFNLVVSSLEKMGLVKRRLFKSGLNGLNLDFHFYLQAEIFLRSPIWIFSTLPFLIFWKNIRSREDCYIQDISDFDSPYFLYQKESNLQQIRSFLRLRIPWSKLVLATSHLQFGAENGEGQLIKNILHYTFLCVQTIGLLLPLLHQNLLLQWLSSFCPDILPSNSFFTSGVKYRK